MTLPVAALALHTYPLTSSAQNPPVFFALESDRIFPFHCHGKLEVFIEKEPSDLRPLALTVAILGAL